MLFCITIIPNFVRQITLATHMIWEKATSVMINASYKIRAWLFRVRFQRVRSLLIATGCKNG